MSREEILGRIQQNKPNHAGLPQIPFFSQDDTQTVSNFRHAVKASAGRCYELTELSGIENFLALHFPAARQIVSLVDEYPGNLSVNRETKPSSLQKVDVAIIYARLGVVENGAVWVREEDTVLRILPFIAEHLVVILDRSKIVQNMHEAYDAIPMEEVGFGVFIGGPSKTADIEQSLVIGAQGPRSHAVLLR